VVGTVGKNKSEIPALFLSGKPRCVHSSIFGCTNELTLVSHVPVRNKTVILNALLHHDDTYMGEEKNYKPEIIMYYNATKCGVDVLDKDVTEYTCTRSMRCWPLKLFNLINVVKANVFVLWMLKYPNWQQKKNNRRRLYLLSLGEEMVTPHMRRRANSGHVDRQYSQGRDSNACKLQTNIFNYKCEDRWRKTAWKELYLSNS
jgi:hypothetical protein